MLALFHSTGLPTHNPWPEGTKFESEQRPDGVWIHRVLCNRTSHSRLTKKPESPFSLEAGEELQWFLYIQEDHTIGCRVSGISLPEPMKSITPLGRLPYPIVPFFKRWKDADKAVMANESYAVGFWFKSDLIEWLENRKMELIETDEPENPC